MKPQTDRDYFFSRVEMQPDGCWPWVGAITQQGYGVVNRPGGIRIGAHRLSYTLNVGPIPDGLTIDHVCHNQDASCPGGVCPHRLCVNPDHLEAVPIGVNTLRGKTMPGINSRKTHCDRGHEFGNTNPSTGWRTCYECMRLNREGRHVLGGKYATHCVNGHEYTPQNTLRATRGRACRECNRLRLAARAERKPCQGCGGDKGPGGRYRYCPACREARA